MTDQISILYVGSIALALVGLVVLGNALLTYGLRRLGRRAAAFRRGDTVTNADIPVAGRRPARRPARRRAAANTESLALTADRPVSPNRTVR